MCKVIILACTCYEFSDNENILSSDNTSLKDMVGAVNFFEKQHQKELKELLDWENCVACLWF